MKSLCQNLDFSDFTLDNPRIPSGSSPCSAALGLHGSSVRQSNGSTSSGPAGGAELRGLLAHAESTETEQPKLDSGVAPGGATPTFGSGVRAMPRAKAGLKPPPGRAREGLRE